MILILFWIMAFICIGMICFQSQKYHITPMPSSKKLCQSLLTQLPLDETHLIYDLGSGWGHVLFYLAKRCPNRRFVGFEAQVIPYIVSKIGVKIFKLSNVEIYLKDFHKQSFAKSSTLICYLSTKGMKLLKQKLHKERFQGTVISHTFRLPDMLSEKTLICDDFSCTPIYQYFYK